MLRVIRLALQQQIPPVRLRHSYGSDWSFCVGLMKAKHSEMEGTNSILL